MPPSVSLPVGVKLYWLPAVADMAGVPEIVARAMVPVEVVVVAVSAAVEGEVTSTPSPPPHAASAQETSKEALMALISLKVKLTLLPGESES